MTRTIPCLIFKNCAPGGVLFPDTCCAIAAMGTVHTRIGNVPCRILDDEARGLEGTT